MKNTIYLLIAMASLIVSNMNGQSTRMDELVNRIMDNDLFNHRYDSISVLKVLFDELRDSIEAKYFTESSTFIQRYGSNIDSVSSRWGIDRINELIEYKTSGFKISLLKLIESQNYLLLPEPVLLDSILRSWNILLLIEKRDCLSVDRVIHNLQFRNSCSELSNQVGFFVSHKNFNSQYLNFIFQKISSIRDCSEAYELLLHRLVRFPFQNKDSLLIHELNYIQNHYDDSSQLRLKLESIINKTYVDSFTLLLKNQRIYDNRYDSIQQQNILEKERRQKTLDSIWMNFHYPSFENMSTDQKREHLANQDTTLWKDFYEFWSPDLLDDGMRFDTFSNAELIDFLDSLSVEYMYPTPFDSIAGVIETTEHIHLQKVCQILGDRKAYGAFDPDSSQQEVINRWIDSLVLYGGLDSPSVHASARRNDASDITIRFGRLGVPCLIKYITHPPAGLWEPILKPEFIFRQITEPEIQKMVSIADRYLIALDTTKAKSLATFMYVYLSKKVYVDPSDRRPRRPVAPTKERQRWHDEHIWPLLRRMNHWYTRRD